MTQTIALHARAPQVSLSDIRDAIQRQQIDDYKIMGMQRDNALGQEIHEPDMKKANALDKYRSRAGANDPEALDELSAWPEDQKKLFDAFDGMSPQQYMDAAKKANAFGEAARRVSAFAAGTPQQKQAWDAELDRLTAAGFIDEKNRDLWKSQGPSPEIINEALTIADYTKAYKGKNAELDRAKVDEVKGRTRDRNELNDARIADIETDNTRADWKTDATIEQGDAKAAATGQNAESLEQYRIGEAKRKAENDKADNDRGDRDLDRKTRQGDEANAIRAKKSGGGATGPDENERGRRIRDIEKRTAKMQEEGASAEDIDAERKRLRKAYEVEPRGTPEDPMYPATSADAAQYPAGTYFITPDGRLIRKK